MLGCNESNINSGEAMVEIHKYSIKKFMWQPHFRTFCELVEGEEKKLTTFSTWTIMLGSNESNINSGEAMVEIHKYSIKKFMWQPHFRTFCELVEGEENKLTTFS